MGLVDYIDRERAVINALKDWHDQHWKLETAKERIDTINGRMYSTRSSCSSTPVKGGASRTEENLCSAIDQKEIALRGIEKAQEYVEDISPFWARLSPDEQFCLTVRFIDHEEGDGIKRIMERFCVERSEAYRRSDAALKHLTFLAFWR